MDKYSNPIVAIYGHCDHLRSMYTPHKMCQEKNVAVGKKYHIFEFLTKILRLKILLRGQREGKQTFGNVEP